MCAWYGVLVSSLIHKFGINITNGGLTNNYQSIYDPNTTSIKNEYLWGLDKRIFIDFMNEAVYVNNMSEFGIELYKNLGLHIAYRFLPRDASCRIPDIFIYSTLAHPYTKFYATLMLGINSTLQQQEELLKKAMTRFLPEYHDNSQMAPLPLTKPKMYIDDDMEVTNVCKSNQLSSIAKYLSRNPNNITWSTSTSLVAILDAIPKADALQYWKETNNFQEIKTLNRILLAFDISSSSTEGFFSILKETITPRRSRMHHDLVSKTVFLRYLLNKKNYQNSEMREEEHREFIQAIESEAEDDI